MKPQQARLKRPSIYATFTIAVLLVLPAGCNRLWSAIEPINGNGAIISQNRSVQSFQEVQFDGGYVVYVTQGTTTELRIEADSNLLPLITSKVEGSKLIVKSEGNLRPSKEIKVYVSSPEFRSIVTDGAAEVHGQTPISSDKLELEVNGSGDFTLTVHAKQLTSTIDGSGKFQLQGDANSHSIDIAGSGDITADSLLSESVKVSISGSGNAALLVSRALDAKVEGAGHVMYRGSVSELHTSVAGSGSVEKMQ